MRIKSGCLPGFELQPGPILKRRKRSPGNSGQGNSGQGNSGQGNSGQGNENVISNAVTTALSNEAAGTTLAQESNPAVTISGESATEALTTLSEASPLVSVITLAGESPTAALTTLAGESPTAAVTTLAGEQPTAAVTTLAGETGSSVAATTEEDKIDYLDPYTSYTSVCLSGSVWSPPLICSGKVFNNICKCISFN